MKIKKFEGTNEQEVIELVKEELGPDALVINIKKIQPKGILSFLRKPTVEVTAAFDEKNEDPQSKMKRKVKTGKEKAESKEIVETPANEFEQNKQQIIQGFKEINAQKSNFEKTLKDATINEQSQKIKRLEQKLNETEGMLEKAVKQMRVGKYQSRERQYQNNLVQVFYDTLTEQGVLPEISKEILEDVELIDENDEIDENDVNLIVKMVYNKIVSILGEPEALNIEKNIGGEAVIVAFIGSTGVGKTTTIAKLSANFILNQNLDVGLITADTYRIAAVEQLKTYADILGIDVEVVYDKDDLAEYIEVMKDVNDVVLLDTAGRSHRSKDNLKELAELLEVIPTSKKYLVLSLTTKYEDLISIVETYSGFTDDFKVIFTKLDETLRYGSILNVCYITGKKVSYVTMGQNVPDDIETIKAEKIAKALLGLG